MMLPAVDARRSAREQKSAKRRLERGVTRTGSRAARIGAFALEMWSRLRVDGVPKSADERARELSWIAENMCALHGVRVRVSGSVPTQPSLLVANHVSYFDPMIISSLLPLTAVAKSEVGNWPMVGEVCRRFGVLYVDRECPHSGARVLRQAIRSLEQGVSVLIFPEGTTTHGTSVLPFKRGSFGAAALAGVPVVPVALRYECASAAWVGDDAFLPHYMRAMAKPYTRVNVDFLPAIQHAATFDAHVAAARARAAIAEVLTSSPVPAEPRNSDHSGVHRVAELRDAWPFASA